MAGIIRHWCAQAHRNFVERLYHVIYDREWVLLNRFRTGQGLCAANMVRWKQSSDPRCSCGEIQTMSQIVDDCIETRFPGGLPALHLADEAAVQWIGALYITHKQIIIMSFMYVCIACMSVIMNVTMKR